MRIAVMAAGAVGGYFGGRVAAAGHDVAFIARGAHGDAIRRNGLRIESALGDLHLMDVKVTDDPKQIGTVDVVLFAVKLWDTETAGEQARALVGSNTRVITFQNGVDSVERLAPILGDDATIGGATYIVAKIARPGVIIHTGVNAKVLCGHLDQRPDALLSGYVEKIKATNIDIKLTDHMLLDLWKKFVLLSGTSGMTASTRQPLGVIRDDDDMRAFFCKLMHDTMAVGRAAGVRFPPDFQTELDHSVATFPPIGTQITTPMSKGRDVVQRRPYQPLQIPVHARRVADYPLNLFFTLRPAPLSRPPLLVQVLLHSDERLHDSLNALLEFGSGQILVQDFHFFVFADRRSLDRRNLNQLGSQCCSQV